MSKFENLSARRFGKLVVIERAPDSNGKTMWLCKCDCGTHKVIPAYRLKRGETTSCGCANRLDVQIAPKQRYGALETICLAPGKGRIRVDDGGNETMFDSIVEAARALGSEHKRSLICDCCRGKRPTAYGYEWRYA